MMGAAGVLETFGGALIILGLFTRPTAFILCGQMAVAYFRVHIWISFWPLLNRRRNHGPVLLHLSVAVLRRRRSYQSGSAIGWKH